MSYNGYIYYSHAPFQTCGAYPAGTVMISGGKPIESRILIYIIYIGFETNGIYPISNNSLCYSRPRLAGIIIIICSTSLEELCALQRCRRECCALQGRVEWCAQRPHLLVIIIMYNIIYIPPAWKSRELSKMKTSCVHYRAAYSSGVHYRTAESSSQKT